jgi:hypothetical protein
MGRIFDVSMLTNRAVIETAVLVILTLAAVLVLHNLHHVSAANSGPAVSTGQAPASLPDSAQSSVQSGAPSNSGQNSNTANTRVTVNGQVIDVPQNGSLNQTVTDGNTTTTVNAQNSSSSSSSAGQSINTNHSSLNVHVNSNSSAAGDSP